MREGRSLTSPRSEQRDRLAAAHSCGQLRPFRRWRDGRKRLIALAIFGAAIAACGLSTASAVEPDPVDPFEVIATLDRASEMELWPGFDASAYPIAIYDGARTLLLRHPDPPDDFAPLEGRDGVWFFQGRHPAMRWNSNADIDGVRTATLLLTIEPGRPVEYEAHILYHEVFHLFSKPRHPTWSPNEIWRYSYPMDDLRNYRLLLLEEEALARAVESESDTTAASWAAAALAIRTERRERLSDEHRAFETALELQEGTAVYMGRSTIGTATETERLREERGSDGIRWRCYETGAVLAVLLDRFMPEWKQRLETSPATTFEELLAAALAAKEVTEAAFTAKELADVAERGEAAIAELAAKRTELVEDFNGRGKKIVVRPADDGERLEFDRFDPMAVEILDRGTALHAHLLTASHPRGEVRLTNPRFVRRSLDGVIALTIPAGGHPFLQGFRQISITGFSDEPTVERHGETISVEAEGLSISFDGALVESTDQALIVSVLPADVGK